MAPLLLEEEGVIGHVVLRPLALDLIPVDSDVLSLHARHVFKAVHVHEDTAPLAPVAQALRRVEAVWGRIPALVGVGAAGIDVVHMVRDADADVAAGFLPPSCDHDAAAFGLAIVLDRAVDLVSCLATQLTYAGLLDETFGCVAAGGAVAAALFLPPVPACNAPLQAWTAGLSRLARTSRVTPSPPRSRCPRTRCTPCSVTPTFRKVRLLAGYCSSAAACD